MKYYLYFVAGVEGSSVIGFVGRYATGIRMCWTSYEKLPQKTPPNMVFFKTKLNARIVAARITKIEGIGLEIGILKD